MPLALRRVVGGGTANEAGSDVTGKLCYLHVRDTYVHGCVDGEAFDREPEMTEFEIILAVHIHMQPVLLIFFVHQILLLGVMASLQSLRTGKPALRQLYAVAR